MVTTVLVAEDDNDIAALVRDVLEHEGYEVRRTAGAATLTAVREERPDVLLLDHNMPGMTGVEVARHLHNDPATSDIVIITMTAAHRLGVVCQEMGANGCLGKPFEIEELLSVVDKHSHSTYH
jgi:CheY-like chemotaxis protein